MTCRSIQRAPRRSVVVGVTIAIAGLLAACSSSGSNSVQSLSGSGAATAAEQTAAAQAAVAKAMQAPTKLDISTPLKYVPPRGKTVVQMQCAVPQCKLISDGTAAAAKALGWNLKIVTYDNNDASSFVTAMQQALQYKPVMVGVISSPYSVWSSMVPVYRKAGVLIDAQLTGPVPLSSTVVSNPGGLATTATQGSMIGSWFVADSKAQGHALSINMPWLAAPQTATGAWKKTIADTCTACRVTSFNATISEFSDNTLVSSIVSALQKDKSIKYVLTGEAAFTTLLPAALKAAGITGVKIAGYAPGITDEQQLLTGAENAFTPLAFTYEGWQLVDVAARVVEGMPVPNGVTAGRDPVQIVTKANVGTPTGTLNAPADYAEQFEKLWHVR